MHPYIPHLLEDITRAHKLERIPIKKVKSLEEIVDQIRDMDQAQTFGYWCGLNRENFPPPDQLLASDMKLVSSAYKKMMKSWGVSCSLPKGLPQKMAYDLLIQCLERKFDPAMGMKVTWGYCNLRPESCVLGKYCTCADTKPGDSNAGGNFIRIDL